MTSEQLASMAKYHFYIFPKLASGNKVPKHLQFIGEKIQEAIEKKSEKNRMLIISVPPRHGKSCKNAYFSTTCGDYIKVEHAVPGTEIFSMDDNYKLVKTKIIEKIESGKKKVCKLILKNGQEIESSDEHRYYAFNRGWVQLKDLSEDDYLAVPWPVQCNYKNKITTIDASLLGIWYADGSKHNCNTLEISKKNKDIINELKKICKIKDWKLTQTNNKKNDGITNRLVNNDNKDNIPIQYLRSIIDTSITTYNFRIPSCVWTADNSITSYFINTFISCDGHFNEHAGIIEITLANKKFLLDLQLLLRRFRIRSKIEYKQCKYQNGVKDAWRLTISDKNSILTYCTQIGSISKKEQLEKLKNNILKRGKSNSKSNVLPPSWRKLLKNKINWFKENYNIRIDKPGCTHIDKIKKCAKLENNKKLLNLVDNDIEWIKVGKIKHTDKYEEMYDLYVENKRNFIANGIVVHNSMLISKHLPAWYLGTYPTNRIILTSYSSELSDQNSDYAKSVFLKWGQSLWGIKPSRSTFNRASWDTEKRGGCISAGVGGSITGFGADLLLIDDYVKGVEEAESRTQREKLWEWWRAVAQSRLHPNSVVIILCTRWNASDLSGKLIQQAKEDGEDFPFDFTYINLPATAEKNDPLNRKPGEVLWPDRYNKKMLLNIRKTAGSHIWASLYQGNPVAKGGNLFKSEYFKYFTIDWQTSDYLCFQNIEGKPIRIPKRNLRIIVTVDPALETKERSDPSGFIAWGYCKKNKIWLMLDIKKGKFKHETMIDVILNFAFKNNAKEIFVENEKIGKILISQSAGRDIVNDTNIPFKEVKTMNKDKFQRLLPMASYTENGRVFFKKDASYLAEFEENLMAFPESDDDCWPDCYGYATVLEKRISIAEVLSQANKK